MAGKDLINTFTLLPATDMTDPVTITSNSEHVQFFDNVGIQFIWTGTPTGNFFVDVSLDNVNWANLGLSPTPAATGSAGNTFVDLNQQSAMWIRGRYVSSAGAGSLVILLAAKMV